MLPLQRLLSKYGWGGAFVAALTPIPDDLVYIPLGLVSIARGSLPPRHLRENLFLMKSLFWEQYTLVNHLWIN